MSEQTKQDIGAYTIEKERAKLEDAQDRMKHLRAMTTTKQITPIGLDLLQEYFAQERAIAKEAARILNAMGESIVVIYSETETEENVGTTYNLESEQS